MDHDEFRRMARAASQPWAEQSVAWSVRQQVAEEIDALSKANELANEQRPKRPRTRRTPIEQAPEALTLLTLPEDILLHVMAYVPDGDLAVAYGAAKLLTRVAGQALRERFPPFALVDTNQVDQQKRAVLGMYRQRPGVLVNGRASFVHVGNGLVFISYAEASWRVGLEASGSDAFYRLQTNATVPYGAALTDWQKVGGFGNLSVPSLKCLSPDALAAEFDRASNSIVAFMPSAMPDGSDAQRFCSGVYKRREETWRGHPTYEHESNPYSVFYLGKHGWIVGAPENFTSDRGWMSINYQCILPQYSTQTLWQCHDNQGGWKVFPQLRCLDAHGLAAERARAAPTIALLSCSSEVPSIHADKLGVFHKRDEIVHDRPSYVMAGYPNMMMWYSQKYWIVGLASQVSSTYGFFMATTSALLPEDIPTYAIWRVFSEDGGWKDCPYLSIFAPTQRRVPPPVPATDPPPP